MEQPKHKKKHQKNKKQTITSDRNDSGHGDSEAASTTSSLPSPVEVMTSRDFQFDTNAHIEMMNQMLKDSVRIDNFKAAILHNKHLFKDKCVLNIGCGSGIYSLFAAKAGAAKVFAIDPSNVVYYTRQIVEANNMANVIEVIKGNIEHVELPVKEVDIIISDWMGYAMLFQSTCDSVIYARDKWLKKPGGLIFPDKAQLFMVALEDSKHKNENIDWWNDVYGFSMNCLRNFALSEPRYQIIRPQQILSKQCPIKSLNLNTATMEDLKIRTKYMLPIERSGRMDGVALYFHVFFTKSHTPLGFSTDPWSPGTNWMQTILFFDQSLSVKPNTLYYGGIEFYSATKPCDLNDMIVNLEMLMGDPTQADVEVEMSWRLKPATALFSGPIIKSDTCNVTKTNTTSNSLTINNKQILKDSKNPLVLKDTLDEMNHNFTQLTTGHFSNQTYIKKPEEVLIPVTTSKSTITSTTNHLTNDFSTIIIGNQQYPCRKNKKRTKTYVLTVSQQTLAHPVELYDDSNCCLERPLHWFVCLLHFNELPFEALHKSTNTGPRSATGKKIVDGFQKIEWENMCPAPEKIEFSTDSKYFYDMAHAISSGMVSVDLANIKPGKFYILAGSPRPLDYYDCM